MVFTLREMSRRLGLLFFSLSLVSEATALHSAQKALCRRSALIAALAAHEPATRFFDCHVLPGIRSSSYGLNLLTRRVWALDPPSADRDLEQYSAGVRASGRGANALLKKRSETGVRRTGSVGSALFAPGQVLDELFCEDNSIVSVVFAFPEAWSLAKGPNLDVRDVRTSDSAFVLAASLPQGAKIDSLSDSFFTDLLFAKDGKYGSYGGLDDLKVSDDSTTLLTTPTGAKQPYRRLALKYSVLTYNQNTVQRRAYISATTAGGSLFMLVASCLANRFKQAEPDLFSIQQSFRVIPAAKATRRDA